MKDKPEFYTSNDYCLVNAIKPIRRDGYPLSLVKETLSFRFRLKSQHFISDKKMK